MSQYRFTSLRHCVSAGEPVVESKLLSFRQNRIIDFQMVWFSDGEKFFWADLIVISKFWNNFLQLKERLPKTYRNFFFNMSAVKKTPDKHRSTFNYERHWEMPFYANINYKNIKRGQVIYSSNSNVASAGLTVLNIYEFYCRFQ